MVYGLDFLHDKSKNSILHLDMRPQNILMDENFRATSIQFCKSKTPMETWHTPLHISRNKLLPSLNLCTRHEGELR